MRASVDPRIMIVPRSSPVPFQSLPHQKTKLNEVDEATCGRYTQHEEEEDRLLDGSRHKAVNCMGARIVGTLVFCGDCKLE